MFHSTLLGKIVFFCLMSILFILITSCAPVAIAGSDQEAYVGEVVDFDGSASYDPDGYIAHYRWQFGDGNIGTEAITSHTYNQADLYTVTLTVTDNMNSIGKDSITVRIVEGSSSVKGTVADTYGNHLEGLKIHLGSHTTTTSGAGQFDFSDIETGYYVLTGSGGIDDHYVADETSVQVEYGVVIDVGILTAYRIRGCGVVIQSITRIRGKLLYGFDVESAKDKIMWRNNWKKVDLGNQRLQALFPVIDRRSTNFSKSAVTSLINENIGFFFITWEAIPEGWTNHYAIQFLGTDGIIEVPVWYSNEEHLEDPDYNPLTPEAYLDLSSELAGIVDASGTYLFRIIGINTNETQVKVLPSISISLGTHLYQYPESLDFNGDKLSWTQVPGADGYRVQVYDDDTRVYDTKEALGYLLTGTVLDVPTELTTGEYYTWHVDAHANDDTGWVVEITRGISGFVR